MSASNNAPEQSKRRASTGTGVSGNGDVSSNNNSDQQKPSKSAKVFRVPEEKSKPLYGARTHSTLASPSSSLSFTVKPRITAFYDPERKVVFFKIEPGATGLQDNSNGGSGKKNKKNKQNRGIAGYTTVTEGDITEVHRARADALASNVALLRSKLAELVFVEACRLRGVEPSGLFPRPRSDFYTEPNRAERLPREQSELRYYHFEKQRHLKLALVCSQEDSCMVELERRVTKQRQEQATLKHGFKTYLQREEAFLLGMQSSRSKYESVLENENYTILETQSEALSKLAKTKNRYARIEEMKKALVKVRKARGKAKQEKIRRHVAKRDRQQQEDRQAIVQKRQEKDAAVKARLDSMSRDYSSRRKHETKIKEAIEERHQAQRARNEEARQKLVRGLARKAEHIEQQLRAKAERMEHDRRHRKIDSNNRAEKAQRIRKAKLYQRRKVINKINDDWARMELMKEFTEALDEERRDLRRLQKIRNDEWTKNNPLERDITPGAGHYNLPTTLTNKGGTWGRFKPKSEWDWIEHFGKQTPGPSDYGSSGSTLQLNGGIISQFAAMSDVDWKIKRAKAIPGPGEYEPRDVASRAGATFGNFTPKTTIEILQERASSIPGPGHYDKPMPKLVKPQLEKIASTFNVPPNHLEFIQQQVEKNKRWKNKGPASASRARLSSSI